MAITHASLWALALAPLALAQGHGWKPNPSATGPPMDRYPTPTPEVSLCEAKEIAKLCEYKKPLSGTAVASTGKKACWEYCNAHPPCSFVIFAAGNPYTGSGSCFVYPGETFDKSLGQEGCEYLTVFDKPVCAADPAKPSPTSEICAATATPSAVAEVCDYPAPGGDCFWDCAASTGAVGCLSQCVKRDNCGYAVFVPRNEMKSQYYDGTCWMYNNTGTFDKSKAGTCSGKAEQFVYENPCPKPVKAAEGGSGGSASSSGAAGGVGGAGGAEPTGTGGSGAQAAGAQAGGGTQGGSTGGAGHVGATVGGSFVLGVAVLLWQGLW